MAPERAEDLCARTTPYAKAWAPEAERLWLEQHPTGKKVYLDELSRVGADDKAKIIAAEDAKLVQELVAR